MGDLIKINKHTLIESKRDMEEYLKPLSRDILLFTTNIAMTYRLKDKAPLLKLVVGSTLSFKHKNNLYDENEIQILFENQLVGFVPECDSPVFAKLMEAGKKLFAIVTNISTKQSIPLIKIDIYLKDY